MGAANEFLSGLFSLARGFAIVRAAPRARTTLWQVLGAVAILTALSQLWFFSGLFLGLDDLTHQLAPMMPDWGALKSVMTALTAFLFVFLAWAANLILTWALIRLLLTILMGLLAERILKHFGRATPGAERFWSTLVTGLKRGFLLLLISMPFAVALLIPGLNLIAAAVFALILAADQMDFAMEALGWSLTERWSFLRRHRAAWLGLATQLMAISLLPIVGVLLLPVTVAGATVLIHKLSLAAEPVRQN